MGGCVWTHRGARFIRHHDRDADNKTYSPTQKLGAFSRHQATLIAFSVKGNRQLASGPLSEMIQNNSTCQEAHAHPLKFKAV